MKLHTKAIHMVLGCLLATAYLAAAPVGSGSGVAKGESRMVTLMADPGTSTLRVPLPEAFTRLQTMGTQDTKAAKVTINFLPAGSPDARWGDTAVTWPSDAKAAVKYAASVWAALLNSSVPIVIDAAWVNNLAPGVLGHSGPLNYFRDFTGAPMANTWYPATLANTLNGSDLDAAQADIYMGFSSTFSWYTGTDGATPGTKYDLVSVVLHEMCHGLGFIGSMSVSGGIGSWGMSGYPVSYDRFTENGSGQLLISAFANDSTALADQLTGGSLYFNGINATASNHGSHPKLYAPATWSQGSSYAHLDEIYNGTSHALMTYSLSFGESIHSPGWITMGILSDVGWPNGGKVAKKQIPGHFYFSGGNSFGATMVLTPDRICSKKGPDSPAPDKVGDTLQDWNTPAKADPIFPHPVPGTWRFHEGKQKLTLRFPDAAFTGIVVNVYTVTGTYTRIGATPIAGRLSRTDDPMFHMIVNRLEKTKMYGGVLFNPPKKFPYTDYRIAIYSCTGTVGRLEFNSGKATLPLKALSLFKSRLPSGYESAYAFLISAAFTPPATTNLPLLIDGTNVFAYDWQTNGFKWFDWGTTNNPFVF